MRLILKANLFLSFFVLFGCSINPIMQFDIDEHNAYTPQQIADNTKKGVYIRNIADIREFTNIAQDISKGKVDPSSQFIPRIHNDARQFVIGRAPNNNPLAAKKEVKDIIRNIVKDAFVANGFFVADRESANILIVDVDIIKYWTWANMHPYKNLSEVSWKEAFIQSINLQIKPVNHDSFNVAVEDFNRVAWISNASVNNLSNKTLGHLYAELTNKIMDNLSK